MAHKPIMPLVSVGALVKVIFPRGSTVVPRLAPEKLVMPPPVRESPAKVSVEVRPTAARPMPTVL